MTTKSITAIGPLAAQLQEPLGRIRQAIAALDVSPALHINGVPHFDESDCERVADYLRAQRDKRKRSE